jgi:ABC-type transport system involved in multi-copper enzyme maturation permease subunit
MKDLAIFRLKLLLKQKLGWAALAAAACYIPFSLSLAFSSYVRPDKIFWDLTTGFCFILAMLFSTYLGSHLFHDEQQRKTLSFVLTLKASRREWIFGNWLGIAAFITFSAVCWTAFISICALLVSKSFPPTILFQAQIFLILESILVLSMAMFFSFYVRPVLAWFLVIAICALLHSKTYLEMLIVESHMEEAGKLTYKGVLFILNFLPPLEWWDIRMFIGFHDSIPMYQMLLMFSVTFAWTYIVLFFSTLKIERMDL